VFAHKGMCQVPCDILDSWSCVGQTMQSMLSGSEDSGRYRYATEGTEKARLSEDPDAYSMTYDAMVSCGWSTLWLEMVWYLLSL